MPLSVYPPETLYADGHGGFVARDEREPCALVLVPLVLAPTATWALADAAGQPVAPAARDWLATVRAISRGAASAAPQRSGVQWRWAASVADFGTGLAAPGAGLLLWLSEGDGGGTWLSRPPAMAPLARPPAPPTHRWLDAVHTAVAARGLSSLADAALLRW